MDFLPGGKQKNKWQKFARAKLKTPNFNWTPGVTCYSLTWSEVVLIMCY